MDVAQELSELLFKHNGSERTTVLSLAGAGCIGKSTLTSRLRDYIGKDRCEILELDAYMLPRSEAKDLTGYDPRRFELNKARGQLIELLCGQPVYISLYNRATHKRDIHRKIEPKKFLLFEGGLALRDEFLGISDVRVFLSSSKEDQFYLRAKREAVEFGSTVEEVRERFARYWPDYREHILPTQKNAMFKVETDRYFDMRLAVQEQDI